METTKEISTMINETLNSFEESIKASIAQLRGSKNCLVACNYIVEVGYQTVFANGEDRVATLHDDNYPTQWGEEGVKEILTKCKWTNLNGEIMKPKVWIYTDWYKAQLKKKWNARHSITNIKNVNRF